MGFEGDDWGGGEKYKAESSALLLSSRSSRTRHVLCNSHARSMGCILTGASYFGSKVKGHLLTVHYSPYGHKKVPTSTVPSLCGISGGMQCSV